MLLIRPTSKIKNVFFFLVGCVDKKVDLDLGNYERFMDIKLTSENNITTGKVYKVCVFVKVMKKVWNVLFLVFLTYTSVNSMCLRKRGEEIILGRLFRLFLILLMLFKNGLSVQLGFQWMDSQVQLMFVS
jgi:hypothetical protein